MEDVSNKSKFIELLKQDSEIKLTDYIDLSGVKPIESFEGKIIGNGNIIFVDSPVVEENYGVLKDIQIHSIIDWIDSVRVGSVARYNYGFVRECCVSGHVNGKARIGGLIGVNEGIVYDSTAAAKVSCVEICGGLVGINKNGSIIHCTATTDCIVSAERYPGGIAGVNEHGCISHCGTAATIQNQEDTVSAGALLGLNRKNFGRSEVKFSYGLSSDFLIGTNLCEDNTVSNCYHLKGRLIRDNHHTGENKLSNLPPDLQNKIPNGE